MVELPEPRACVVDGCDRPRAYDGECEVHIMERDLEESYQLLDRQGKLLTGVVNALKGEPPELTSWSHHDAPELASSMRERAEAAEAALAQLQVQERDVCDACGQERGSFHKGCDGRWVTETRLVGEWVRPAGS